MLKPLATSAEVVLDSITARGQRIVTLQLCYPRFVHSELMTHRVFSRNAMSSLAVPVRKMIAQVREEPAMPVHWGSNQPGMQAGAQLEGQARDEAVHLWRLAAQNAALIAVQMDALGLHKQVANRILEPFQWMRTIVTATEWANWDALRDHPAAEPNMQVLAYWIKAARAQSVPCRLTPGRWHLPYVSMDEHQGLDLATCLKISTARCARVSYLNHDGTRSDTVEDIALHDRLVISQPMHSSPAEHQASPDCGYRELCGNFVGWVQYRKFLEHGIDPAVYPALI